MENITWINATQLGILGKGWENSETYYRLKNEDIEIINSVNSDIQALIKNPSGFHVDFVTNSKNIWVKWEVKNLFPMPHITLCATSGLDIYTLYNNEWRFLSTAQPQHPNLTNTAQIVREFVNIKGERTFSINLPLYDELISLEIGIDNNSTITPLPKISEKPILFYGSSITQGACASRPGMSHTNIIRRKLGKEVINLGFSGTGRLEHEMTHILMDLDPQILVMDCVPNMEEGYTEERFSYFYENYRKAHKTTPILFQEQPTFADSYAYLTGKEPKNVILNKLFNKWQETDNNIYYLSTETLYGDDFDATVDCVHATDLGFYRMTNSILPKLKEILSKIQS